MARTTANEANELEAALKAALDELRKENDE